MSKRFENLENAMCKELEKLDKKYSTTTEMAEADAKLADMLYHALKSAETYHAMADAREEEDEMSGEDGRSMRGSSYARMRNMRNGRYMSRGMGGYSGRYDDGYSGYYPMDGMGPYWGGR